jgi:putative tricarboxylic transport membrane protein
VLDNAVSALFMLLEPTRLVALFAGMAAGMVFGMLPGLGGVAAVSILLPFIYMMDSYAGLALLLGAISVIYTSDTITSVLVGAPGSPASAPTAIEGHALAKQGKAATALGVGFLASMVGGVMGAIILSLAIPIAGPLVLALGTPELFMFALVGLYYASAMVGRDLAVGLGAACFGVLLGVVGAAPAAADYRFTFGQAYLMDGISLTIVALGLFAVAELIGMIAGGGGIAREKIALGKWGAGFPEFWRNRWLVLRSSLIGVFGGFVPAVGANASTWVAYGHAISTTKDKSRFGKGEIRGVASAEGANNATVISDLVPTLLFSVPGGPAAAIFLGALFSFGFYPGPRMVSEHPDLMYVIVWSVALASVLGAIICFAITPAIARLTQIRFALIAAPLLLVMVAGAYQSTRSLGDIFVLLAVGVIGWLMKHANWPRAPVLVGFVLATPMEQYFWLTTQIHGWSWLNRPGVLIIGSLILIPLLLQVFRAVRRRAAWGAAPAGVTGAVAAVAATAPTPGAGPASERVDSWLQIGLAALLFGCFAYAAYEMMDFNRSARLLPSLAIVPGALLCLYILLREGARAWRHGMWVDRATRMEIPFLAGLLAYGVGIWLFGFDLSTIVLLAWLLLYCAGMRLLTGAVFSVILFVAIHGMFSLMRMTPPEGVLLSLQLF